MNAIKHLLNEHEVVRNKLHEVDLEQHREAIKIKRFDELAHYLDRHETMEHEAWYPQLEKYDRLKDIIVHLISEEKAATKIMTELHQITDPVIWAEKFAAFKKAVNHHAAEEENKLFPQVRKILNDKELEEMGMEIRSFNREVVAVAG